MQSVPILILIVAYMMIFVLASGLLSLCMAFVVKSACGIIAGFKPYYDMGLKASFFGTLSGGIVLSVVLLSVLEAGSYACMTQDMCIPYAVRAAWGGALGVLASFIAHGFVFGKLIDDPEMVPIRLWRGHAVSAVVHIIYLLLATIAASIALVV